MALDKYQLEALARYGATEADTKPKKKLDAERIAELETIIDEQNIALMELAELISELIE